MSELNYSENTGETKRKRGRPSDPNALKFKSVGLKSEQWDYLMQWGSENEPDNPTLALANYLDELRRMAPAPGYSSSRPRDEKGRWKPDAG